MTKIRFFQKTVNLEIQTDMSPQFFMIKTKQKMHENAHFKFKHSKECMKTI